jgi:hypothetical protein
MPSGGARAGAGRPRKADKFARPIAQAEKRISDKLPWLVDKALELAEGVWVEQETQEGPVVYKRPPDRQAIEYLLNRIMGKPTERQEVEQSGGVTIRVEYADGQTSPSETA